MDTFEANGKEEHHVGAAAADDGWHKVTYAKKQRRQKRNDDSSSSSYYSSAATAGVPNSAEVNGTDKAYVFRSVDQQAEDRHRRILEARKATENALAVDAGKVRSKKQRYDEEDEDDDDSDEAEGNKGDKKVEEKKKVKQKKPKKPKVNVAEAAAKIDATHLAAFIAEISGSYEGQQEIQLMRFADYFGRAFSAVTSAQFPWMKVFRESTVAKITDIPLSHISDAVYKTSTDWINQHSIEALASFVTWSLDSILADLAGQHVGSKVSKKGVQQASSKSQVAIFVVLAMVLRRKPDVLVNLLSTLRESSKYQGQDKLLVVVWMVVQASQGDLSIGLYSWARNILPIVSGKSSNPQSRDLVLQLVEKILSSPKARTILVNGAVRRGERLMPPSALEILIHITYPASSARVKATERFEAIYPTLKEVALAGANGSKAMKQVAQQILMFAVEAAGEGIPELSKEAACISIWCLTQNADCYKQWEKIYQDNLDASIAILKRLSEDWKELSVKLASFDPLRETIKNFRLKNEKAMGNGTDPSHQALYRDADKYCKAILGKVSHGNGCMKGMAFALIAVAAGAAIVSPNLGSWDWKKLSVFVNSHFS